MQDNDQTAQHFKEAFREYEVQAPQGSWENIRSSLHPEVSPGVRSRVKHTLNTFRSSPQFYPWLGVAATLLLVILIWASYSERHRISGHAYAGDSRLTSGTAYLFRVYDREKPYDTVMLLQKARIDQQGYYSFPGIEDGKYLVRINPLPGSEISLGYLPSFFGQKSDSTEATLIMISREDPVADVYLINR
jgi:hypothetical protein